MNRNLLISYLAYLPFKLLILATRRLPLAAVFLCGRLGGYIAYHVSGNRRRVAAANLKAAFGDRYTPQERDAMVRGVFQNLALNVVELLLVPRIDRKYLEQHVACDTWQHLDASKKRSKGTILLTAHYGNWELLTIIAAVWGYHMVALAREQKPEYLNKLLNEYRQMKGCSVIGKGMQMRQIVKALQERGIIGILGDQSGRQGKEMMFLGRSVFMAEGAFRLAARTNSEILPVFMARRGIHHELFIGEPILKPQGEVTEEDIHQAMARYRDMLEQFIRASPEQWMWVNKRWKHSPQRIVLILTDGRTGHLRQAEALAEEFKRLRSQTTRSDAAVAFRSQWHEGMLTAAVRLGACRIGTPAGWLKWALTPQSYHALANVYADIVICTGSQTRAVGILISRDNLAKCVSIMNPAPFRPASFDLSFIPGHDAPAPQPRVVVTDGALTRISEEFLAQQKARLSAAVALPAGLKIGIMLGGETPDFMLPPDDVQALIEQVQRFRKESGAYLMFTTSRRTSSEVDAYLHAQFDQDPRCLLKVFPNELNFDFAVGGMLAVCDVIIISGESISMVSEAAASAAYPVVFMPRKKNPRRVTKHERFLRRLSEKENIRLSAVAQVYDELRRFQNSPCSLKRLDDAPRVRQAIQTLV